MGWSAVIPWYMQYTADTGKWAREKKRTKGEQKKRKICQKQGRAPARTHILKLIQPLKIDLEAGINEGLAYESGMRFWHFIGRRHLIAYNLCVASDLQLFLLN